MARISLTALLVVAIATSGSAASSQNSTTPSLTQPNFELQKVADGVYAAIRTEPAGMMFDANVVVIVNDDDVVVVDTNISPTSARQVLAALRSVTDKPVRYVVNTHWHEDHILGNTVYRDAFPGVEFIGHASTLEDLPTVGASNRKQLVEGAPGMVAFMKAQMAKKKDIADLDLTEEERISYLSDIALVERYLAEASRFEIILPTIVVEERLTLRRGRRTIDIRHLGRAHTGADLVVHLPEENILISGDLVVWPVPLVGSTSYPVEYAATLERLLELKSATIVPGHGPVMRDDVYVRLLARLLASIRDQTKAALGRGETLDEAKKSVDLSEFRKLIAGESQLKRIIFNMYVTQPGIDAAYRQLSAKP